MQFEVTHCHRFAEEDSYENGCLPETAQQASWEWFIRADTLDELLADLCDHASAELDDVDLDACDQPGRVDICVMENERGLPPSEKELEEWKAGRCKLWSVIYTFYVQQVERRVPELRKLVDGHA